MRVHAEPMALEGLPCVREAPGMELEVLLVGWKPSEGWEAPSPMIITFSSWAWASEASGSFHPGVLGCAPAGLLVWVGIRLWS